MQQYLELVQHILDNGSWQDNRTGVRTLSVPGAMMRFDLQQGFPAITTKKLAFKSAMGELVGFLRGYTSAADFRKLGCKVWDQNANENTQWLANPYREKTDALGPVYGAVWRGWPAYKRIDMDVHSAARIDDAMSKGYTRLGDIENVTDAGKTRQVLLYKAVDQLRQCLDTIVHNPSDRRIIFHGWNLAQLDEVALPSCHLLYQFHPNASTRELSMCLYIRSNDIGLGSPWNLAEGAALLHLVAHLTGYTPRWFTCFIGDAHLYESHIEMLREQLTRKPLEAPKLRLSERVPAMASTGVYEPQWLDLVEPSDFGLEGYQHHPALTAPMAV